ncbi:hypothetical protein FGO68_gene5663 [Halteria grandinella]|uniref:Uncharacterized protein n=1 Tax=Halteria grandinella TaxID=5974 RepID=A0A8J8NTQ8_HALGN|nr:hypothetical protein FGO68_gene5663 [Halteria grandinella]
MRELQGQKSGQSKYTMQLWMKLECYRMETSARWNKSFQGLSTQRLKLRLSQWRSKELKYRRRNVRRNLRKMMMTSCLSLRLQRIQGIPYHQLQICLDFKARIQLLYSVILTTQSNLKQHRLKFSQLLNRQSNLLLRC